MISNKDTFEYWNGEELSEMKSIGFEIFREPRGNTLTAKDEKSHQKAVSMMKKGEVQKARKILLQLIKQNLKEQSIRGNYAATWANEDTDRCIKEYEEVVKDFPDYLFARCMLASYKIEEGLVDEAEQLLGDVFTQTTEYHISEYILMSGVSAYLQAVKGNEKGALTYFDGAEKAVEYEEEHEALKRWKDKVDVVLNPSDSFDIMDNIDAKKLLNKIKNMKLKK